VEAWAARGRADVVPDRLHVIPTYGMIAHRELCDPSRLNVRIGSILLKKSLVGTGES